MSDAPAGGPEGIGEATPGVEQPTTDASQPSASTEAPPPRQYLEVDDPDNRWDRVKVDNEEIEVPYSELKRGYSREADYTRKTQALAEERKQAEVGIQLQQALRENPQATVEFLARQYGLNIAQPQAQVPQAPEFDDPLEAQLYEERQARISLQQRFEEREADNQLQVAVTGLRQQFNLNDDDIRAVISTAHQNNLGINALPMVAKQMMFDRIYANIQARQQMTAQQQAEDDRRRAAAASASAVVGSGTSNGNGLSPQVPATANMSLREVIEAAVEQHS